MGKPLEFDPLRPRCNCGRLMQKTSANSAGKPRFRCLSCRVSVTVNQEPQFLGACQAYSYAMRAMGHYA